MPRGPTVDVETCLRCSNPTAAARRDQGVRHRLQIVDSPEHRAPDVEWGQLCPACWTGLKRYLHGAERDDVTAPPPREPATAE